MTDTLTREQIEAIASGNMWPTDAERKALCDLALIGLDAEAMAQAAQAEAVSKNDR